MKNKVWTLLHLPLNVLSFSVLFSGPSSFSPFHSILFNVVLKFRFRLLIGIIYESIKYFDYDLHQKKCRCIICKNFINKTRLVIGNSNGILYKYMGWCLSVVVVARILSTFQDIIWAAQPGLRNALQPRLIAPLSI